MPLDKIENKSGWLIGGGVFASLVASLCCVGPLILTLAGVSGAATLAQFEILRIPMTVSVFAIFGVAGFTLYQKRNSCEPGSICADPRKYKTMVTFYWLGLIIAILGVSSPYWIAWLYS